MNNKPRNKWIAGALSMFSPGLGQIYNGQPGKGLILFLLSLTLYLWKFLFINPAYVTTSLILFAIVIPAYYLFNIIDAVRNAKQRSYVYEPKKYNTLPWYIALFLIFSLTSTSISGITKNNLAQTYKIPGKSMEPTLLEGDCVFADKRAEARCPKKNDIIIFKYPKDETKDFCKRVIAISGDTVEIKNKQLIVNGNNVKEVFVEYSGSPSDSSMQNTRDNLKLLTIPSDSYFVLGDSRDRSLDSRFFGVVHKSKVKGIVKSIYWSWDSEKFSVRWTRIGKEIL